MLFIEHSFEDVLDLSSLRRKILISGGQFWAEKSGLEQEVSGYASGQLQAGCDLAACTVPCTLLHLILYGL
jgi:hypothetical protein